MRFFIAFLSILSVTSAQCQKDSTRSPLAHNFYVDLHGNVGRDHIAPGISLGYGKQIIANSKFTLEFRTILSGRTNLIDVWSYSYAPQDQDPLTRLFGISIGPGFSFGHKHQFDLGVLFGYGRSSGINSSRSYWWQQDATVTGAYRYRFDNGFHTALGADFNMGLFVDSRSWFGAHATIGYFLHPKKKKESPSGLVNDKLNHQVTLSGGALWLPVFTSVPGAHIRMDHMLKRKSSFELGYSIEQGLIVQYAESPDFEGMLCMSSVLFTALVGRSDHRFESFVGGALVINRYRRVDSGSEWNEITPLPNLGMGYRYQPRDKRIMVRTGFQLAGGFYAGVGATLGQLRD